MSVDHKFVFWAGALTNIFPLKTVTLPTISSLRLDHFMCWNAPKCDKMTILSVPYYLQTRAKNCWPKHYLLVRQGIVEEINLAVSCYLPFDHISSSDFRVNFYFSLAGIFHGHKGRTGQHKRV